MISMATDTHHHTAEVEVITSFLTPGIRGGLIFHAVIGTLSAISLLLLLGHLFAVSFLPFLRSALNIRNNREVLPQSSTGASSSAVRISMSAIPDRKSTPAITRKNPDDDHAYGVDLERAGAAERRARARASEISRQATKYNEEKLFLRMQLSIFIVCMLLSDLVQTVGVLIQARWAHLGFVQTSTACSVQAAMLTFGDVATAVWNAIIAVHTFSIVVLGLRMSALTTTIVVILGWSIPIMTNVIGSVVVAQTQPTKPYYNVASAWCFIGNDYVTARVVLHYVPLLFSALIITIMYTLVSLRVGGNLEVTPVTRTGWLPWFSFSFRRSSVRKSIAGSTDQNQVAYLRSVSLKMLWYPCVYICLILPISICRMVELRGAEAPAEVLFFCMTLLFCVGISNITIYMTTRNLGIRSKRTTVVPSVNASHATQVEIYIDRVTQRDFGAVTAGGTGRDRDRDIRFEGSDAGDTKRDASQKDGYDAGSRSSLESLPSVTQFRPTSPKSPNSVATSHPQYAQSARV